MFTFAKRRIQCNIAYRMHQEVLNTNHLSSVSDSLGQLVASM